MCRCDKGHTFLVLTREDRSEKAKQSIGNEKGKCLENKDECENQSGKRNRNVSACPNEHTFIKSQ